MIPSKKRLEQIMSAETVAEPEQKQKTAIERFVNARVELRNLEKTASDLEFEAIDEAFNILQDSKNNVIYQDSIAKVVIQFRQKYLTSKELPELKRLEEEITVERGLNSKRNAQELENIKQQLEALNEQIEKLEARKETLLNSKRIQNLLARHQQCLQENAYKEPGLSVYFK